MQTLQLPPNWNDRCELTRNVSASSQPVPYQDLQGTPSLHVIGIQLYVDLERSS